jgi:hypothetical protein
MKSKFSNFIKCALFLAAVFAVLVVAAKVVERKESNYKYADFFTQAKKGNIDVLFLGSSHVINGYNPDVLYKNYGYTSYNMGGHGSVMQSTYWELIESLDYCSPKWVVVDTYMLEKNFQYLDVMEENADDTMINTSVEQLHLNMDCWPLNKLKIAAVKDLIRDKDIQNQFLFDFMVYHSRWSELDEDDYKTVLGKQKRNDMFGAEMRYEVERTPIFYPDPENGQGLPEHTVGQEYLMKIIDECQRRGIGVLVTYLPFCATTEDKMAANSAGTLANIYGVPYINMINTDIIDMYTDLNDTGHLNVSGAFKVTDYIGQWLFDNADLTDHRGDAQYQDYEKSTDAFYESLKELALEPADLYTELSLLSLQQMGAIIYFNQDSGAFSDASVKELVRTIGGKDKIDSGNGPYILIDDAGSDNRYEASLDEMLDGAETAMGSFVYQPVEKKFRFLYTQDNTEMNYLYDDDHVDYDIQIIMYDKDTGELLGRNYFKSYGNTYRK